VISRLLNRSGVFTDPAFFPQFWGFIWMQKHSGAGLLAAVEVVAAVSFLIWMVWA
jgi:hypothetical protein